jgi:protein involved in polysaccharide export with SLBB domain
MRMKTNFSIHRNSKLMLLALALVSLLSVPSASAQAAAPAATSAAKPHDDTFVIGNGDVLSINVWKEPDISRLIPVRSDGKISLPLVGEVQAAGLTPAKLEKEISGRLKNYISEPEVTVMVEQVNSQKVNILGQVVRPGWPAASVILPRKNRFTFCARGRAASRVCRSITRK